MTLVFLDTEFNAHGGDLISIALASSDGSDCYEVVEIPSCPHPWVKANVIPKLDKEAVGHAQARQIIFNFIHEQGAPLIIADWPADFEHLLGLMYKEHDPSMAFPIELRMELINSGKVVSRHPHNALADACGLRDWYMEALK